MEGVVTRDPPRRAAAGLPRRGSLRGRRDADPGSGRRPGSHPERLLLGRSVHAPADERRALVRRAVHARRGDDGRGGRPGRRLAELALRGGRLGAAPARLARVGAVGRSGPAAARSVGGAGLDGARRSRHAGLHRVVRPLRPRTSRRRARRCSCRAQPARSGAPPGRWRAIAGCRVIGSAGSAEKLAWLRELGFDDVFDYREQSPRDALAELAPDGIDIYFDNVGGDHLEAAIGALRTYGRVVACGSISRYNDAEPTPGPRNMFLVVTKRLRIAGLHHQRPLRPLRRVRARGRRSGCATAGCGTARRSSRASRTRRRRSSACSAARTSGRCSSRSARPSEAALPALRPPAAPPPPTVLPHRALPALRALRQARPAARSLTARQPIATASGRRL